MGCDVSRFVLGMSCFLRRVKGDRVVWELSTEAIV